MSPVPHPSRRSHRLPIRGLTRRPSLLPALSEEDEIEILRRDWRTERANGSPSQVALPTGNVGLRQSNRRRDVAAAERLLAREGLYDLDRTEGPTGIYSSGLDAAIRAFQRRLGRTETGVLAPAAPSSGATPGPLQERPTERQRTKTGDMKSRRRDSFDPSGRSLRNPPQPFRSDRGSIFKDRHQETPDHQDEDDGESPPPEDPPRSCDELEREIQYLTDEIEQKIGNFQISHLEFRRWRPNWRVAEQGE